MQDEIVIHAENLTKTYQLYENPIERVKEALHPLRKKYHHSFNALTNVSFSVKTGEALGIVGRNGCGKSTLLQIVCGILKQTSGVVNVKGRISALLELGAGFNPEYTGKQNVYLNGEILGFSIKEIDERFDEIAAFADIGNFINQPVKTYSSGMYVRLAFAVQVCVNPEVLVVDEALSVGDIFFQQKCYNRIRNIISKGTTCLFVSHDTSAIQSLCKKTMILKDGVVNFIGDSKEAVSRYFASIATRPGKSSKISESKYIEKNEADKNNKEIGIEPEHILINNILDSRSKNRHGERSLEIIALRITDKNGNDTMAIEIMEKLNFYLLLYAHKEIHDPSAGIHLYDRLGNLIFAAGTRQLGKRLPDIFPENRLIVKLTLKFNVQPGEYVFSIGASEPCLDENPNIGFAHDRHELLGPITVNAEHSNILPFYGIAKLPMNVSFNLI